MARLGRRQSFTSIILKHQLAAAAVATTSIDWFVQPVPPVRNRAYLPTWLGEEAVGLGVFTTESTGLDKWYTEDIVPRVNRARLPSWLGEESIGLGVFTTETTGLDKWYVEDIIPRLNRSRLPVWLGEEAIGLGVFTTETTGSDKWKPEFLDFLRPVRRIADAGLGVDNLWQATVLVGDSTADRWQVQPDLPLPNRTRLPSWLGEEAIGLGVFVTETTGLDRWSPSEPYLPSSLPRLAPLVPGVDNFFQAVAPVTTSADQWLLQPDLPVRNGARFPSWLGDATTELGIFTTETVGLDDWYVQASEPPRFLQRLMPLLGELSFTEADFGIPVVVINGPFYLDNAQQYVAGMVNAMGEGERLNL